MTDWPRFDKAPITEALLDMRAKLPTGVDLARLATFQDAVKDLYPTKRERTSWQSSFQLKPGEPPEIVHPSGGPDGYLFTSRDGKQIVQARLDGFTFNRLKPYDEWKSFRDEARQQWERYVEIAAPEIVSRVALRYINRIEIPMPLKDFREYVLTGPEIAPKIPQGLAGFFMRLVIPDEKSKSMAIVTQTMEDPTAQVLPLILDIDVFREAPFDVRRNDMWEVFEQLRKYKNEIFFNSITDKTKELFK